MFCFANAFLHIQSLGLVNVDGVTARQPDSGYRAPYWYRVGREWLGKNVMHFFWSASQVTLIKGTFWPLYGWIYCIITTL